MSTSPSADRPTTTASPGPTDRMPQVDIGIDTEDRKNIAQGLSEFLSDAFTLYLKTHNFHWNVTGSMFNSLHTMFETQYTEQWAALDDVAERIRALGFNAPGSYREFAALTSIAEDTGIHERSTLYSSTEFKKIRLLYFTDEFKDWEAERT